MTDKVKVIRSPLCRDIEAGGKSVRIEIYEDGASAWLLEHVDQTSHLPCWDSGLGFGGAANTVDHGAQAVAADWTQVLQQLEFCKIVFDREVEDLLCRLAVIGA